MERQETSDVSGPNNSGGGSTAAEKERCFSRFPLLLREDKSTGKHGNSFCQGVLPFAFRAKVQPSCWKEKHSQDTEESFSAQRLLTFNLEQFLSASLLEPKLL